MKHFNVMISNSHVNITDILIIDYKSNLFLNNTVSDICHNKLEYIYFKILGNQTSSTKIPTSFCTRMRWKT